MNKHTILATALLTLGLGLELSTSTQITSAKSSVKIIKTHHMNNALSRYSFNGNIYSSSSLKKVTHKGYNYPKTKWTVNDSAKIKKADGKTAVYYNIKNAKVSGWIWRGYLSNKPQVKKAATYKKANKVINWKKPSQNKAYPKWSKLSHRWIYVSTKNQKVYIHGNGKVQYIMNCSTGKKSSPTPKGTFHIQAERGYSFYNAASGEGAHYWVSWLDHGIYLFHSVPTNSKGHYVLSEAHKLGKRASHGCVRLSVPDARWMYKTVPYGVKVVIH